MMDMYGYVTLPFPGLGNKEIIKHGLGDDGSLKGKYAPCLHIPRHTKINPPKGLTNVIPKEKLVLLLFCD